MKFTIPGPPCWNEVSAPQKKVAKPFVNNVDSDDAYHEVAQRSHLEFLGEAVKAVKKKDNQIDKTQTH